MSGETEGAATSEAVVVLPIPRGLQAIGTRDSPFEPVASLEALPMGAMCRVTRDDLDVVLVHTARGLAAIDDRCPHMAAPLSLGELDGCVVGCPLHSGRFDLTSGGVVQFPTTGGLDADGAYHPTWSPPDREPRPEPADLKARARAATRIRRLRYYPLRIRDGIVELAWPA
ncbi:MAG TPA: Rieske 2Fe-2S domain-containing protein [Candidatus Baltobacteraceae bacterium]|nr:Rieske 2Fe-2S domain-containing protein [Candidatus Baltobacteraceae bacterium]